MTEANYTELAAVPPYEVAHWVDGALQNKSAPLLWGVETPPPVIGTKIKVTINSIGPGTVVGYFTEFNWLGLLVELHDPPKWWLKQNPDHPKAHVFGIEFKEAP